MLAALITSKGFNIINMYTNNNIEYPYTLVTHNIRVSVRTNFLNDQSDEDNNLWVWSYSILIENNRNGEVQLIDRYWKITDETGQIQEVKGAGVIGQQPIITPQNSIQYTSGPPFLTSSINSSHCACALGCWEGGALHLVNRSG